MARIRLGGLSGDLPPDPPRIRLGGLSGVGLDLRIRLGGLSGAGIDAPFLAPFEDVLTDAVVDLELTAVLGVGSVTPDEYVWTQVSGAPIDLPAPGQTVTIVTPADAPNASTGTVSVLRCTPWLDGGPGVGQNITISTLSCLFYVGSAEGIKPGSMHVFND